MMSAVASSLPYAVAILLSTMPVLAIVLLLVSARPPKVAAMFALGWFLGSALILGAIVAVIDVSGAQREVSRFGGVVRVVLGAIVGALAVRSWKSRDEAPQWIEKIGAWSASRTLAMGAVAGTLNPKNLALLVAGAAAILRATTAPFEQAVAIVVFATVASVGTAVPVAMQALGGPAVQRGLHLAGEWMKANGKALSTIVLAIIAVVLIVTGASIA